MKLEERIEKLEQQGDNGGVDAIAWGHLAEWGIRVHNAGGYDRAVTLVLDRDMHAAPEDTEAGRLGLLNVAPMWYIDRFAGTRLAGADLREVRANRTAMLVLIAAYVAYLVKNEVPVNQIRSPEAGREFLMEFDAGMLEEG